ncbi:MAG: hypothetical protein ACE5JN_12230 [Candidatus Methylomirabilia bacterium]
MASLEGDLIRKRFGQVALPSVLSRTWLVWSLAELGEFAEGIARAEDGVQIAGSVDHTPSLANAYFGAGLLYLGQGELQTAIPPLERGLVLCQVARLAQAFPMLAAPLGSAYALSGRIAEALPLLERAASISFMAYQSLQVGWLSEAYLFDGRMEEAIQLAGSALQLARAQGNAVAKDTPSGCSVRSRPIVILPR